MTPAAIAPPFAAATAEAGGVAHWAPEYPSAHVQVPLPPVVPEPSQAPWLPQSGQALQAAPQYPTAHVPLQPVGRGGGGS